MLRGRPAIEIESGGLFATIRPISMSSPRAPGPAVVEITAEARDDAVAVALGYRSMNAKVEVECSPPRDKVDGMDVYSGAAFHGERRARRVPGVWAKPSGGSLMNDVVAAVCRHLSTEPPSASPVASATHNVAPRSRALALAGIPPRAGDRVALSRVAAPVAASVPTFVVQLGAFSREGSALARLKALGTLPAGLSTRVGRKSVDGVLFYRAIVAGFADASAARSFCAVSGRNSGGCWAHPEGQ